MQGLAAWAQAPAIFNPDAYLAHIKYLASPELKGRATGSPELETAANYIAFRAHAGTIFRTAPINELSFLRLGGILQRD